MTGRVGRTSLPKRIQRRRRGIFVEPQPKLNLSPVGAAYSDDIAPERSLGELGCVATKISHLRRWPEFPIYAVGSFQVALSRNTHQFKG